MNTFALTDYTDADIQHALDRNLEIIENHRGLKAPQPAKYWKAVEDRQKLQRELTVRGIKSDPVVNIPDDRLPMIALEISGDSK